MQRLKYLVPNGCTAFSLLLGLASVHHAVLGNFELAAWMILWGVLLDKLDGSTARLFNASSSFGAQFDSFADFVSFGIAPAFLFLMATGDNPMVHHGWMMASGGVFVVAVAVRLARFNIAEPPGGHAVFHGIPTTLMGALLSSGYLTWSKFGFPEELLSPVPFLLLIGGFAMVSGIRIPKLKMRRSLTFNVFQIANVAFAFIVAPLQLFPEVLFSQGLFYLVIGILWCAIWPPPIGVEDEDALGDEEVEPLPA